MATRRVLLPIVLLCAIVLAGCSKEPAADDDGEGCSIADCPPTETPSSSETASNTTTTSTASNTTTTAPPPRAAITFARNITDNAFPDGTFTVQKDDKVIWTHRGTAPHTVTTSTGAAESFDSGTKVATQTYEHTFSVVGSVPYHCNVHPSMTGTITVVETMPA